MMTEKVGGVVAFGYPTATQKKKNALFMGVSRVFVVAGGGIYTHFLARNKKKEKATKGNITTYFSDGYKYAVLIGCFPLIS